jgi:aminoglycoside phosphotransferase (APT) family kinase protein
MSNTKFKLNAASGSYVLRRQPARKLLKSAHAVDHEYRVRKALTKNDVLAKMASDTINK